MTPLTLTALIGLGILAATYALTLLLYYRWWRVSQQAIVMALQEKDVTARQLDKMLKKIRVYATGIKYCRQLTLQIPLLGPVLVLVAVISYLV